MNDLYRGRAGQWSREIQTAARLTLQALQSSTSRSISVAVNKLHNEFHTLDMENGWQLPEGYDPKSGALEKILSGSLDTANKRGSRTRLLKFPPGLFTKQQIVHDHWEEVFLVSGDLTVGNDENGQGGQPFAGYTYAVRPPGAWHGPFKSEGGCLLLEMHYYDPT
jgi:hypothetical protein